MVARCMACDSGVMGVFSPEITKYVDGKNMSFLDRICLNIASQNLGISTSAGMLRIYADFLAL